jgi:hypothetical protein
MKYYLVNIFRKAKKDLCRLDAYPEGMDTKTWKIGKGVALAPGDYPEDARIAMSDDDPAMRVADIVPNARNLLIVSRPVKEVMERVNQGPTQYLPLTILNHRKRPASTDHFIVHPTGTWKVLDLQASEIEMLKDKVVGVDKMVFDPKLLADAPDLFRVPEQPYSYYISHRLLEELRALRPEPVNLNVEEIEQSAGR